MPSQHRKKHRLPDGREIVGAGPTPEAAELALKRKLSEFATFQAYPSGTFAQFVEERYWPYVSPDLRPNSKRRYNQQFKFHILPVLGAVPVADVSLEDLQALRQSVRRIDRRKEPQGGAKLQPLKQPHPTTVREVVLRAKEVLRLAYRLGATQRQDWELVKLPSRPERRELLEPEPDFTPRILDAAKGTYMLGPMWAALFLGLRRGEACGLRWSAINRENMTVTVSEQLDPKDGLTAPKGGRVRVIHITPELVEYIDRLGDHGSPFVFTDKGRPLLPNEVSKQPPRLCNRAGLRPVRLHDLRHMIVSNLLAVGAPLNVVMEIVGHSNAATTMRYAHMYSEPARHALMAHLESLIPSKTG